MKTEYCVPMVAVILTENLLPFLFSTVINASQVLEQAKQRVANEKKKQSEKKRKAENHHLTDIFSKRLQTTKNTLFDKFAHNLIK